LGVEKGDRVVFLTDTIVEHAVAYVGATKCGAILSNLHAREAPKVIEETVRELDPEVLVCQPKYAEKFDQFVDDIRADTHLFAFDHAERAPDFADSYTDLLDGGEPVEPTVDIAPEDPAFINYTSGTTGKPKGIVHTHAEGVESAHMAHFAYQIKRNDVDLHPFPTAFIGWPMMVYSFGSVGATVVFLEAWQPEKIPDLIEEQNLSYVVLTPTQWKQLLEAGVGDADTSSVDRIAYAGETISEHLFEELREKVSDNLISIYGGTELMNSGTVLHPEEITEDTLASVGRPTANTDVRIVEPGERDPSAQVERGEAGEVIVRGPSVAKEVWNDPEKTAEIFHEDGWWFSGDLGRIKEDNRLYLEGRVDNMIISGGMNVYAEGVESALEGHDDILEAAVVGTDHEEWGTAVKAFVRTETALSADELDEWCQANDELANYQRPREYEFVTEFPRTNTGKLNRSALRE
jgi:acyl-coenzyme A synthetase/AMP-(fatty) acid ligase